MATDNKVSDLSDTSVGNVKAIMANTIATAPRPMFVKGVTFLRLSGDLFVGKDGDGIISNTPEAILSTPTVNNAIERSIIIVFTARTG
jgi:hypothetical protein